MIKYTLKCEGGHSFESWFDGVSAFEKLHENGMLECPECGNGNVERAVMAPRVSSTTRSRPLSSDLKIAQKAIEDYRRHVESSCEDVGVDFAKEARAIHAGDAPVRSIRGEAKVTEARELIEDGVPVVPIPSKVSKTN